MRQLTGELKFEYIADCAVLVEMKGQKMLADGLIWDDMPFDKISEETEKQIMDTEGEFEGLDTLLFTHCHEDHFSAVKTVEFLKRHPEAFVAVPDMSDYEGAGPEEAEAFAQADVFVRHDQNTWVLKEYGDNIYYLKGSQGEVKTVTRGGVQIEYMKTGHLTFDYPEHYAFNILGEDCNVILSADADLLKLDVLRNFTMKEHSFIFISNIVLWHRQWRENLNSMGFEKVFIYHIPKEENDSLGYRRKALKCWGRYREQYPRWEALNIDEVH